MSQKADFSNYPLPPALTRRVVTYLNVFRLFISFALMTAFFTGFLVRPSFLDSHAIPGTVLISYFVMAVYVFIEARRPKDHQYLVAQVSLFTDILFLAILLFIFGRLESGISILLIFASVFAAILLPMRIALSYASIVVFTFIGESLVSLLVRDESTTVLVQAGLSGAATLAATVLGNLLSRWLRDYRLTTERQAVQLTRMEQVNELVIRRMRNGVLAVDSEGQIQLINESAWFLLGSPKAGQRTLSKISPQLNTALSDWYDNPSVEIAPITVYGSQARVVPKFVALPGASSIRTLIFLEDNEVISQRAVEMSAQMLANLSGSIAHEIRNPLAAISHSAQLLEESEEIAESDLRLVDIIHSQTGRMDRIVKNILQLSRHEKSRPDIFDLVPFLREIAEETSKSLPGIRLTLDIEPEEKGTLVLFDRSQLHQVVWKLLENANRHARLDAAMPKVLLSMKHLERTGYCIISVEDNGPGIPETNMERIFEPFFTTHKEGSGLGLYIARQLCDVNQAELTVDSVVNSYSRFHIRLALARSEREKNTGK